MSSYHERFIAEDLTQKVDKYLRREDTVLARAIQGVCSLEGEEYRVSKFKRGFELAITTPIGVLTAPVSGILGVVAKLEDGGPMFFVQNRVGKCGEPTKIIKIRSMREGADGELGEVAGLTSIPEEDPRNTKLGEKMRAYEIDELPQFLQVLAGDISLVDIRSTAQFAVDSIRENRPETSDGWFEEYQIGQGLINLNSAMNKDRKNDLTRYHYDMLYARKASLGLDLYIIFKTSLRMARKLEQKLRRLDQREKII